MANSPALTAFLNKMHEYFGLVHNKLNAKTDAVTHAANTLKLSGSTLAESIALASGYSAAHVARRDNPHGVTAAQTGSYTTPEFEALLAQKVSSGIIPISRYGTLSFLPTGVSGSFEGATTVKSGGDNASLRESFNMQVEDNGTLTFLRNGTDGSTQGVYYGYVINAVQGFVASKATLTTRRYKPPFVAANDSVAYMYCGGTGVLAGRVQDAVGVAGNIFIALMNGTLNGIAHSEVWLDPVVWEDRLNRSEVILGKDKVYILYNPYAAPGLAVSVPMDFELYEIPLSLFGSGQTVTPTKLTIGQCTGFLGAQYATGNIRLAAVSEAKDAVTPAMVQHIDAPGSGYFGGSRMMGGSGRIMSQSAFNADGTKLRSMVYHDGRWQAIGGGLQTVKFAFSWVLNMTDMSVTLDPGITPMTIELIAGPALKYTGTVHNYNNGVAIMNYTSGDISSRTYLTESGLIFCSRIAYNPTGQEAIYRGKWTNFTNVFDYLKAPMADRIPELREALTVPLSYGSALGDSFDGFRVIPGNHAVSLCRNLVSGNALVKVKLRDPVDPLVYNYTYKSVLYPAGLEGFKPTIERETLPDAVTRVKLIGLIQEMDDNGLQFATGSTIANYTGGYESRYVNLAADLSTSGTVSATLAQLGTLRDQIITTAGFDPTTKIGQAYIEVVIPQKPNAPVYAIVSMVLANLDRRIVIAKVDVSTRTGAIATLTMGAIIGNVTFGNAAGGTGCYFDTANGIRNGSHIIYETADSFLIAGNSATYFGYAGGSSLSRYRFILNKADGSTQNCSIATATPNVVAERWGGLPGYGIGGVYSADFTTKLMFGKTARTKTEFIAWTVPPIASAKVLLSQEVTQGWIVYFTEDTPVIINGVVGVLTSTNINLTVIKADPSNSTFYVYVQMVAGVPSYVIYDHYEVETDTLMFIGTVQTNTLGISVINVEKVTKFAGFRLSTTPAGSSIPATTGLPSREAHLDPNWL